MISLKKKILPSDIDAARSINAANLNTVQRVTSNEQAAVTADKTVAKPSQPDRFDFDYATR